MALDNVKRGRHFAASPALSDDADAQREGRMASAKEAPMASPLSTTDPGETAVFLRAAGIGSASPDRSRAPRPDETAVFLAAARGISTDAPVDGDAAVSAETKVTSDPGETAVFLAAALAARQHEVSDKPLLSDDDWTPRGAAPRSAHARVADDDDWTPMIDSRPKDAAPEVDTVFGDAPDMAADDLDAVGPAAVDTVFPDGEAAAADGPIVDEASEISLDDLDLDPGESAVFPVLSAEPETGDGEEAPSGTSDDTSAPDDDMGSSDYASVGRSAGLMTVLTIVSRVTGFIRTWAMAAAIGMSLLSSSYQVANNLPNMLYELVMGGMLVTAFLPVYMGVRREQGREASNEYVGNLLGILLLILGAVSILGTVFAPGFIWTQSFLSGGTGGMDTAVFMFRFFAIQILFYGLGSVFSGVLNAHRDYFWSTFAPVLNNVIVIASFMAFGPVSSAFGETAAVVTISAGTTLGVFVQMACQIPALAKHGVHPHIHVDFHDPAIRQTVALGVPTLLATVCMFVSTSITNAAALVVQPETGPSVIAYARLWYTLPYALIAASLSTALYTELSHDAQEKDFDSVRTGISNGVAQMLFFLIPFALYLIVFSRPLNMIYCAGKFDESGVALVSEFLVYLAVSLPLYGVVILMQKSFSALLDMKPYSRYCLYSAIGQAGSVLLFGVVLGFGMPAIALSYVVDYVILGGCSLWWLRRRLHGLQVKSIIHGLIFGLVLGGLGAAAGAGCMWALETFVGTLGGSILRTLAYVCVAGVISLVVTFGLAVAFKLPEVASLLRRR